MREGVIEAAPIGRQIAAAMRDADLQFGEPFEVAVEDQLPDAQRGIQRMSDGVREIMVAHPADQAGAERMQENQNAEFLDAREEFFQARARQVDAPDIGAQLDPAKSQLADGAVQFGDRHAGVLQRHRTHAHQPVRMPCDEISDMIVDHMAAIARHFRRRRIDEVTGVGRDHLHVDAVAVHVGEAGIEIGQFRKVDLAALRLDAPGEIVDMGIGIGCLAASGNAGRLQHHGIGLRHHAVAVDVDGAPAFCTAGARRRAAVVGRGAACLALKQHCLVHSG